MAERTTRKMLVRRPGRIATEGRHGPAANDPDESAELELVSTQMLKVMLSSRDDSDRKAIAKAARATGEGILARHPSSGRFEIIDEAELAAIVDANRHLPRISKPEDATIVPLKDYADDSELALVSTHALRKVLDEDEMLPDAARFNPYDAA